MKEETKLKIKKAINAGYKSGKIKPSYGMLGKKVSNETKEKISKGLRNYYGDNILTMSYKRFKRVVLEKKGKRCENCGWAEKRKDGQIPVEVHCLDGNHENREIKNYRVLCPNDHSLTDNYSHYRKHTHEKGKYYKKQRE